MTTPDLTVRITEILRKHQWRKYEDRCRCDDPGTYDEHPDHVAALIAQAAEQYYRPGIETVKQLDALPTGSVVVPPNLTYATDIGQVVVKWPDHYLAFQHGPWYRTGYELPCPSDEIDLPARVLWSPGAGE